MTFCHDKEIGWDIELLRSSTMATEINNKRRRTAAAASDTLQITDLPVGILVDATSYLARPSRALFAAAMSAPSSHGKMI